MNGAGHHSRLAGNKKLGQIHSVRGEKNPEKTEKDLLSLLRRQHLWERAWL